MAIQIGHLKEAKERIQIPIYGMKFTAFDRMFKKKPKNPV